MKLCASALFLALLAAHADTLILKDGTRVTGRWWSVDASEVHFLVDNQLQHYARTAVSAVAFGDQPVVPPPPTAAPSASAPPSQPPARPPAPSLLTQPARPAPSAQAAQPTQPAEAPAAIHEPEAIGVVYLRKASEDLEPLERSQAVERKRGSAHYWEMAGARSNVRLKAAPELVFLVKLPPGINPETVGLYPLAVASGARRTSSAPGKNSPTRMIEFTTTKGDDSTYTLTVKDLDAGEYAFSRDGSNDAYCFAVDAATGK